MKKTLLTMLLALVMTFAFTACGSSDSGGSDSSGAAEEETTTAEAAPEPTTEAAPDNLVDEEGQILDGYTSGTDTYEFITFAEPLYDDKSDEDGTKAYTIYLTNEDTNTEETMLISFNYADFTSDNLEATPDVVKKVLADDGIDESAVQDLTIDGAQALQYTKQIDGHEATTTTIFHDGNYIDVTLYSVDADPSDFAHDIYNEVISKITINK